MVIRTSIQQLYNYCNCYIITASTTFFLTYITSVINVIITPKVKYCCYPHRRGNQDAERLSKLPDQKSQWSQVYLAPVSICSAILQNHLQSNHYWKFITNVPAITEAEKRSINTSKKPKRQLSLPTYKFYAIPWQILCNIMANAGSQSSHLRLKERGGFINTEIGERAMSCLSSVQGNKELNLTVQDFC